jgi:hypothetical protein
MQITVWRPERKSLAQFRHRFVLAFCSCQEKNTQQSHGYYKSGFAALPGSQLHIKFEWCRDRIFWLGEEVLTSLCLFLIVRMVVS